MAIIEIEGLAKSYRVYQKKEGLLASMRRAVPPRVSQGAGGARHRSDGRVGRNRRLSRPQRRRQDDDAQDALGRDLSDRRHGPRAGLRPLAARERLPPPVRPGDGPEEPALVGPAGPGVVPPAPQIYRIEPAQLSTARATSWSTCSASASCSASRCASCRWASG